MRLVGEATIRVTPRLREEAVSASFRRKETTSAAVSNSGLRCSVTLVNSKAGCKLSIT